MLVVLATLTSSLLTSPAKASAPPGVVSAAGLPQTDLRQTVLSQLSRDPHLDASGIGLATSDGIVTLTGTVAVSAWRERASRVAAVVRGVRGVVNAIRVVPVRRADTLVAREVVRAVRGTAALVKMPISVRVLDGVVDLDGAISSWEQQQFATRVASAVPGVRFCRNQLILGKSIRRAPRILAADVESRLDWDPLVQHAPIRVAVRGSHAILNGTTGSQLERRRAIALAWVKGVTAVEARGLRVDNVNRPDPNLRLSFPTDPEILATIQDLARYWPTVTMSSVSISVLGGVATVRGTVPTLAQKLSVETMVRSAVGLVDLRNELRGPWWTPPPSAPPPTRPKRAPRVRSRK